MSLFQNLNNSTFKMYKLFTTRRKDILGVTKGHYFGFIYKLSNVVEFRLIPITVCLATSCDLR